MLCSKGREGAIPSMCTIDLYATLAKLARRTALRTQRFKYHRGSNPLRGTKYAPVAELADASRLRRGGLWVMSVRLRPGVRICL